MSSIKLRDRRETALLLGPLSLVNHDPDSKFIMREMSLGEAQAVSFQENEKPLEDRFWMGDVVGPDRFRYVSLVNGIGIDPDGTDASTVVRLSPGQELRMRYQ
jgi:hypothetical protein